MTIPIDRILKDAKINKAPELRHQIEEFYKAIPKEKGTVCLTIVRKNNGFSRLYPKYTLLSDDGIRIPSHIVIGSFILNAKKKAYNKSSNYLISMAEGEFEKEKESYIGKLRSLSGKSKYIIYDDGESASDFFKNANISRFKVRSEL